MKRLIWLAVLAAVGCGSANKGDPKVQEVKEDPRIKRAGVGTGTGSGTNQPQQGMKGGR